MVYGDDIRINESGTDATSQMLISADKLTKSFYSTISADLGIINRPNILTDEKILQEYTSNFSNAKADWLFVPAGPAEDSYDALKDRTGKPEVTASTIFTSYLCQVPKSKVPASMAVSVLLADLVFLRALWTLIMLGGVYFAGKRDKKGKLSTETFCFRFPF